MKPVHLLLLLAMNFCWAAVYSAYKVIGLPTGSTVTLRFGLAALCMAVAWPWLPGKSPRGMDLVKTCVMGLMLYVGGQRLQVYGNEIGTAGNSAILIALEPLITSLAAAIFLHEHIGPRRVAGFILGMAGVALLNGIGSTDFKWASLASSLIFVSSFVCEAGYSVVGKGIIARAGVMRMLAISLILGTIANVIINGKTTFQLAQTLSSTAWLLLLGMGLVCTVLGYTVWFVVIRECPISVAALTIFAQSVFGVLIAAVWVGEKLRWGHFFGSAAILAGLGLGLSRQVHRSEVTTANS